MVMKDVEIFTRYKYIILLLKLTENQIMLLTCNFLSTYRHLIDIM